MIALCSSSFPVSSRSGRSLFNECVRMLEDPSVNDASIAAGSRVAASPGNSATSFLPAAAAAVTPA
jgi:hypothetical protein